MTGLANTKKYKSHFTKIRNHRLDQMLFYTRRRQVANLKPVNFLQSDLSPQLGQPINLCRKSNIECLPAVLPSFVGEIVEVQKREPGYYRYNVFFSLTRKGIVGLMVLYFTSSLSPQLWPQLCLTPTCVRSA